MAEKNSMEMLSALMGEQGQDALQMLRRMERLKKLMGSTEQKKPMPVAEQKLEPDLFARNRQENMLSAAIPFLDRSCQRELYLFVRLMEMRRVLQTDLVEVREKAEEPPALRRRKLLGAVQPYLQQEERQRLENIVKFMDMKAIMEREGTQ